MGIRIYDTFESRYSHDFSEYGDFCKRNGIVRQTEDSKSFKAFVSLMEENDLSKLANRMDRFLRKCPMVGFATIRGWNKESRIYWHVFSFEELTAHAEECRRITIEFSDSEGFTMYGEHETNSNSYFFRILTEDGIGYVRETLGKGEIVDWRRVWEEFSRNATTEDYEKFAK